MPFQLLESEDSDMANAFDTFVEVFQGGSFFRHLFPRWDTPATKQAAVDRLLDRKRDPHARFLKVVDTATGETAGHAVWLLFDHEPVPLADDFFDVPGDVYDTPEQKEQSLYALREFAAFRRNAIDRAGGNMLVLDILAVTEKYQRKGIGRMLVQWGTALADKLGYPAVVESSNAARGLYESEGFHTHYKVSIVWPRKWEHLKEVQLLWLTRPARNKRLGDDQITTR